MMPRVRVLVLAMAVLVACGLVGPLWSGQMSSAHAAWQDETLDRLILNNGRIVEGRIIRETETEVEIEVIVAGISAPAVYPKSEIIEIERVVTILERLVRTDDKWRVADDQIELRILHGFEQIAVPAFDVFQAVQQHIEIRIKDRAFTDVGRCHG